MMKREKRRAPPTAIAVSVSSLEKSTIIETRSKYTIESTNESRSGCIMERRPEYNILRTAINNSPQGGTFQ